MPTTPAAPTPAALTNWAGNVTFTPAAAHRPRTVPELQALAARSRRWRVMGSGHSFSPLAATSGDLVSLAGLPVDLDIDPGARTATVGGGTTYAVLAAQLHAHGWALPAMASLPHISVAGAVATGTHGSGDHTRSLAASVRAIEAVVPGGDLLRVDRDRDPDVFPGHVVSLGALGGVVRVTLDVEPTYDMRQDVYEGMAAATLLAAFDEVMSSAHSVSAFTDLRAGPDGPRFAVWRKARVPGRATTGPGGEGDVPAGPEAPAQWLGATRAAGPRHPVPGADPAACTEQLGRAGPWHERLPHFRAGFTPSSGEELQSEFLVPRVSAWAALTAVLARAADLAPLVQTCEVRTVARDDLWLSPATGHDVVGVHVTWEPEPEAVLPAVRRLHDLLDPLGARPHWGKITTLEPAAIAARYPRIDDVRRLAAEVDPHGALGNPLLDALLRP
ncbi:MAG: FAD-binding protein [Kineosporiaceae bacterium]